MEFVQLVFLGAVVGFVSSFFGIGGGSLIVPVLYGLYDNIPPSIVISVSLGSIFIIVTGNTYKFYKQKLLPPKSVIINFLIFCTIGSFIGSQIVYLIDNKMAKLSMGIILVLMVAKILFLKKIETPDNNEYKPNTILFAFTGFFGAFLSSITGLGGGIIFTPFFMNILRVPTKRVSPYSNLAMMITTFIGVFPHLFIEYKNDFRFESFLNEEVMIGNVHFGLIAIISLAAFFSSHFGVKYNSKISSQKKKYLLAILLFIFSLKLLIF